MLKKIVFAAILASSVLAGLITAPINAANASVEDCKVLTTNSELHQNIGWPRNPNILPSQGMVKVLVMAVDFVDAPARNFDLSIVPRRMQLEEVSAYYQEVSNSQFSLEFQVFPEVVRMPKISKRYGDSEESDVFTEGEFATHLIVHDALNQIQNKINLYQFSAAIALVTGGRSLSGRVALALSEDPNYLDQIPGGIHNEIVVGDKALDLGYVTPWRMLVHEINHLMGIPDLYQYGPTGFWQGRSPGPFGQQGYIRGESASDSLAYNRWLLGWITNSRVRCLTNLQTLLNLKLEPQKTENGGVELVLIKISNNKIIALETPKNKGFQSQTNPNSILIYTVDSNIQIGDGPIRLIAQPDEMTSRPPAPDFPDWRRFENAALFSGETAIYGKYLIANRQVKTLGKFVQLTVLPREAAKAKKLSCSKGVTDITFWSYFEECPDGFAITGQN